MALFLFQCNQFTLSADIDEGVLQPLVLISSEFRRLLGITALRDVQLGNSCIC